MQKDLELKSENEKSYTFPQSPTRSPTISTNISFAFCTFHKVKEVMASCKSDGNGSAAWA